MAESKLSVKASTDVILYSDGNETAQKSILFMMNDRINQSLNSLKKSSFRSKFRLTQKDRDYISGKGLKTISDHAFQFIYTRVAPDFPKNDGKQTPMRGHPVFIAQHATATCCRGCISKWHGIEKGRALSEKEVDYVVALIMGWIGRQVYLKMA